MRSRQNFKYLFQRLPFSCYTEILFCNFGEFQLVRIGRRFFIDINFEEQEIKNGIVDEN
jgi:hypothetical protein